MTDHPIHSAAARGDLREVEEHVARDKHLVGNTDALGWTAIFHAALNGREGTLLYLLSEGADIGHRDRHGSTALHRACGAGQTAAVKLLLRNGAPVSVLNEAESTPLRVAASAGHVDVVHALLKHGGSDLDARDRWGMTSLFGACYNGHTAVVRVLLEAGADPTVPDENGRTPLDIAKRFGQKGAVNLLKGWERALALCKSRRTLDTAMSISKCIAAARAKTAEEARQRRLAASPAFLRSRVSNGQDLPVPDSAIDGDNSDNSATNGDGGVYGVTVRYAMGQLKGELFVELMEGMGLEGEMTDGDDGEK